MADDLALAAGFNGIVLADVGDVMGLIESGEEVGGMGRPYVIVELELEGAWVGEARGVP